MDNETHSAILSHQMAAVHTDLNLLVDPAPWAHLDPPSAPEARLVDATLRCVARWGIAKTTLDDVAREAGCSRATVYRTFPGGKDALIEAVARTEVRRFLDRLAHALHRADTLEDRLVAGITEAGRAIAGHAALQFLFVHEPELILPRLAFGPLDDVLAHAGAFVAPFLEPWLDDVDARRVAEWLTRIVLSYTCSPSAAVDTTDPSSVRLLVHDFVLPGLTATVTT